MEKIVTAVQEGIENIEGRILNLYLWGIKKLRSTYLEYEIQVRKEIQLESYARLQDPSHLDEVALSRVINGLSQGKYEPAAEHIPETFGIKKSSDVMGENALIARCQWHKRENVLKYLSKEKRDKFRKKLQSAYEQPNDELAKKELGSIRLEIEPRLLRVQGWEHLKELRGAMKKFTFIKKE